jgi:GNAT superfamily N-acetyltransferase
VTDVTTRRATPADLPAVYDVFLEHEADDHAGPPPSAEVPPFLEHERRTGELRVAERGGRIVGFAALLPRGPVAYLAELFVRRAERSTGIGARLLREILPTSGTVRCTLSSRDPRALALYVRAGMRPRWPNVWLRAPAAGLGAAGGGGVRVVEAAPGDPELVRWDAQVSGRPRPEEHAYWAAQAAVPLWFERRGARIGYAYVQTRDDSPWPPPAATVGPIGAGTAADALDCVGAAVAFARSRAEHLRLAVPGPHPALPALLTAGFRITDVETFLSTGAAAFPDPERYVGSGGFF